MPIKRMTATIVLSTVFVAGWLPPANGDFSIALIGDMPYSEKRELMLDELIEDVNEDDTVELVMHAGDIKAAKERCDDDLLARRFEQLQTFKRALIYTPGDNEWTNCHGDSSGNFLPTERLDHLRELFFSDPHTSTGQQPIDVIPQSATPGFEKFVENVFFVREGVVFGTIHVVGSRNNLAPWRHIDPPDSYDKPRPDRLAEFRERNEAGLAWLNRIFDEAAALDAPGVFIMIHANPRFDRYRVDDHGKGYEDFLDHLSERALAYGKPVLLAHGDGHEYIVDKPFVTPKGERVINLTRVQTFGSSLVHWVKVTVSPKDPALFTIRERLVPENIR